MDPDPAPPSPLGAPRPLPSSDWRSQLTHLLHERPRPLALLGLVATVVILVMVVPPAWSALAGSGGGAAPEATLPRAGEGVTATTTGGEVGVPAGTATTASASGPVVVHAAGAVVEPGVYELPAGARVDDLVVAAGGLAPDADADRVNLALPLVDGERVYVPAVGEAVVPEAPGPSGDGATGEPTDAGGAAGGGAAGAPVDVNTADLAALEELPGIGPVTAQAIVDHRAEHGLFASVDDLLAVNGIGEAKLAQLRDHVVVGG